MTTRLIYFVAFLLIAGGCFWFFTTSSAEDAPSKQITDPTSTQAHATPADQTPEHGDSGQLAANAAHILVMGDSISAAYGIQTEQGWVSLLKEKLHASNIDFSVINASVSGETTGGALARLPDALKRYQPEFVIIELGGNDGLRGYPIEQIRENLLSMVTQANEAGAKVLLAGMQIPPNYGPRYTRGFINLFKSVSDETESLLMPFFLEPLSLNTVDGRALLQSDGIHPTVIAQPLLLEGIWPYIRRLIDGE